MARNQSGRLAPPHYAESEAVRTLSGARSSKFVFDRGERASDEKASRIHGALGSRASRVGRILEVMKPTPAATRRFLPTSPFKPPPAAPPAEQFAVQDQVTHDKYGFGRVISVEEDTALVIDFGTRQVRITMPCAKLAKL